MGESAARGAPAPTADAAAEAGLTGVVQDVLLGEDLRACVGLDEELRHRTPRIGLCPDTSAWTPGQTVEAILANAQRTRVA